MIAVEQRIIRASNPRSVVGTRTKIYEYLKLLYSVEGKRKCTGCGAEIGLNSTCDKCGTEIAGVQIRHFSFNSKIGMCKKCSGRGYVNELSIDKIIKSSKDSLLKICTPKSIFYNVHKVLPAFARTFQFDINTPYEELSQEVSSNFSRFASFISTSGV